MMLDTHEVLPHPSEPGLLQLAPLVLDKLLCDDPISDHLTVEPQPFARGKYATVRRTHRTIRLTSGGTREEWYAAKYQRKQRRGTNVRHGILHEAAVLYLLRHEEHVVQLRGLYESSAEMILLLQLAPHGELQRLVDEAADGVGEAVAQECVRHTLLALAAMHALNLAHLDLKPQNLLLMAPPGPGCCVKLCDFGITREMRTNVELREVLGTPDYVAPEVLQYEPICLATDMWSVGVLAYVLLSGHSPFAGDTKQETFLNITQGELDFPDDLFEDVSSTARDFIGALIQLNPQSRLTVKEALNHSWLSGFSSLPPTIRGAPAILGGKTCPPDDVRLNGTDTLMSDEQTSDAEPDAALTGPDPVLRTSASEAVPSLPAAPAAQGTRLAARKSSGDWTGRLQRQGSSAEKEPGVLSSWEKSDASMRSPPRTGDSASLIEGTRARHVGVEEETVLTAALPQSSDAPDATQKLHNDDARPKLRKRATLVQTSPHYETNVNNNEEEDRAEAPRPAVPTLADPAQLQSCEDKAGDPPHLCTSRATISLKCDGRPVAPPNPSPSHAAKPKLPPKPCNLTSPGAVSPKKQNASKPPVARKPAVPDKPWSDGSAPRPVPCGVSKQTRCAHDTRTSEQVGTSGSPSRMGGNSTSSHVRRQKSNSPTSLSSRGSPQPLGSAKNSPRLSRPSRGSPQPTGAFRNSPPVSDFASFQLNRSCKSSPETTGRSGESPGRCGSSSRSPQLNRPINTRVLHSRSKEGSPQPSASKRSTTSSSESRPSEGISHPKGHKSSPVIGRKARQSPSGSPARGASMGSPSPSRRPLSSNRMSSESPPPYRKSWPAASAHVSLSGSLGGSDATNDGGRPSRYRHSSSPARENEAGAARVSRSAQQASPTRHLSRRLQESPNRNCCRPRLEDCDHQNNASLRAASPSPPRLAACTRSPRAARTIFARNVEALHKGSPTNQPLKASFNLTNSSSSGGRINATFSKTTQKKCPDSPTCQGMKCGTTSVGGGCAVSPASRKTPSHSPPMFQPAPKKSNTVSDFFTTSCSLRARDCSEKSDGELLPFSGIVETSHLHVGPPTTPPGGVVYKFSRHPVDAGPQDITEFSYGVRAPFASNNAGAVKPTPPSRDRLPLHAASPKSGNQPKTNQTQRQTSITYEMRGTKPVPKPRPAHLTIKSPGAETLQCPPVSSCFAVFSSSSLSSPENSTHNSFSSSQSSGSLPSRQCLSPCSTSSSCSDFSFTKPWPDNAVIPGPAAVAPFSLKLQRGKENDRNALNSPTEAQKNLSWRADAAGDGRVALGTEDDSAMDVDPYSSLEGDDESFGSDAVVVVRRDEDLPQGSVSHC